MLLSALEGLISFNLESLKWTQRLWASLVVLLWVGESAWGAVTLLPKEADLFYPEYQKVWGNAPFEVIEKFSAGNSAANLYKITISGHPYVLRFLNLGKAEAMRQKEVANLKAAAQKGVGPSILASGPGAEFVVMAYIPPQQDAGLVGEKYAASLAETLRQVHERDDSMPQASIFAHIVSLIEQAAIPKDSYGYRVIQALLRAVLKIQESFRGEDVRPTHGDIHRDNVLFDGQRFWLIDWESAQLKSPYEDLTQMMNFIILDPEQEAVFLKNYFNHVPSEEEESKFYLMRIVTLFHAGLQDLNRLDPSTAYQISQEAMKNLPDHTALVKKVLRGEMPITENIKKMYAWGLIKQAYKYTKERNFQKSLRVLKGNVYRDHKEHKKTTQEALKKATQSASLKSSKI